MVIIKFILYCYINSYLNREKAWSGGHRSGPVGAAPLRGSTGSRESSLEESEFQRPPSAASSCHTMQVGHLHSQLSGTGSPMGPFPALSHRLHLRDCVSPHSQQKSLTSPDKSIRRGRRHSLDGITDVTRWPALQLSTCRTHVSDRAEETEPGRAYFRRAAAGSGLDRRTHVSCSSDSSFEATATGERFATADSITSRNPASMASRPRTQNPVFFPPPFHERSRPSSSPRMDRALNANEIQAHQNVRAEQSPWLGRRSPSPLDSFPFNVDNCIHSETGRELWTLMSGRSRGPADADEGYVAPSPPAKGSRRSDRAEELFQRGQRQRTQGHDPDPTELMF